MINKFLNRHTAGQLLARKLQHFALQKNVIVLALPRGGVPVGYEIAHALGLPLDVFLVRKLGIPDYPELAFGAIAMGHVQVFNDEIINQLHLDQKTIDAVIQQEESILNERTQKYRGNRAFPDLKNQTVILVDDGVATGATMRAAIKAIRTMGCLRLVVAIPVAPKEILSQLNELTDQIICLAIPEPFVAVGNGYQDFPQTTDAEVDYFLNKIKF